MIHVDVSFPDVSTVRTSCRDLVVETGLPPDLGGDPEAVGPFDLLLCSLAACTGFQIVTFLQERGFSIADAGLTIEAHRSEETHLLDTVSFQVRVPKDFPEKYEAPIARAMERCFVKKQLGERPEFTVSVSSVG